jgi:hypothetical protein
MEKALQKLCGPRRIWKFSASYLQYLIRKSSPLGPSSFSPFFGLMSKHIRTQLKWTLRVMLLGDTT